MSTDELNKETKDIKHFFESHPNILVTIKNSVVQIVLIVSQLRMKLKTYYVTTIFHSRVMQTTVRDILTK